jgi:hypothetical protein
MPEMPQTCKVANTLWTPQNFQTTDAEKADEVLPYHHSSDMQ